MSVAPLYGLVLAGGRSTRMQRDKATLTYGGVTQLDRAYALLTRHTVRSFVSVRTGQAQDPARAAMPLIIDSVAGEGPLIGIRSALAAHPGAAWLVLACDLPFVTDATLEGLVARRDVIALATVYRSVHDGLPEPLCAIWEPHAAPALAAHHLGGSSCPRKFLIRQSVPLIDPVDPTALENVNTPAEYLDAQAALARVVACN